MAAEARADKDEAGMIAAALIEVFARLLTALAGLAARIAAGHPPRPELRAITAPATAPVVAGLLPRVRGWLGGRKKQAGPIALAPGVALPHAEQPRTCSAFPRIAAQPSIENSANRLPDFRSSDADAGATKSEAARERVRVPSSRLAAIALSGSRLATWRLLPASTAGPVVQKPDFPRISSTPNSLRYRNVFLMMMGVKASVVCIRP